ncbi:MAG: MFS transporter [Pseudomonadales bacterium]|nr:MFS transporter [Pseudomonadales bacterium]
MFYGWKLLVALCFIYLFAMGPQIYGFVVVLPSMVEELGWSRTSAGAGFSVMMVSMGLVGPLVASGIGKFGVRPVMFTGGLVAASGALLTYFTESLVQFYLGAGVLMGIGIGMQTVLPGSQVITNWFTLKRATALGAFMAIGGVSAFLLSPLLAGLIESSGNWRLVWLTMTAGSLIASGIVFFFVVETPQEKNQNPDGVSDAELQQLSSADSTAAPRKVHQTDTVWPVGSALRTRAFWFITLGTSIALYGSTTMSSQLTLFLKDAGFSPIFSGSVLGMTGIAGIAGRVLAGVLGDRIEPRLILLTGLILELLSFIVLLYTSNDIMAYSFAVLFGLGFGFAFVAATTVTANYFGPAAYATLFGVGALVGTLFAGLGPILSGLSYDKLGSYQVAFYGYAAIGAIVVILIAITRPPMLSEATETE